MDTGVCPPLDVWEDSLHENSLHPQEQSSCDDTVAAELRDHLKVCPQCRARRQQLAREKRCGRANRANRLANIATALFSTFGFALVLSVSLRTPVADELAPFNAATIEQIPSILELDPPPTALTRVVPASASGSVGE